MSERQIFNQINKQQSTAYRNGTFEDPTVLIKRTSGNVSVARLDIHSKTAHFHTEEGKVATKTISIEHLADEYQEQLAAELAGRALRGAGVQIDEADTTLRRVPSPVGGVRQEFNEQGLIVMPNWNKGQTPVVHQPAEVQSSVQSPAEVARETDPKDALLAANPILKHFTEDLRRIAQLRKKEESEGHRYGMDQFFSSDEEIRKIIITMNQMEKAKIGDNRERAICRYIDLLVM